VGGERGEFDSVFSGCGEWDGAGMAAGKLPAHRGVDFLNIPHDGRRCSQVDAGGGERSSVGAVGARGGDLPEGAGRAAGECGCAAFAGVVAASKGGAWGGARVD